MRRLADSASDEKTHAARMGQQQAECGASIGVATFNALPGVDNSFIPLLAQILTLTDQTKNSFQSHMPSKRLTI